MSDTPVYLLVENRVHDLKTYMNDYVPHVEALLAEHGGAFLFRGGNAELLEGTVAPGRIVIMIFPSEQNARQFWDSSEFRRLSDIRRSASAPRIVLLRSL